MPADYFDSRLKMLLPVCSTQKKNQKWAYFQRAIYEDPLIRKNYYLDLKALRKSINPRDVHQACKEQQAIAIFLQNCSQPTAERVVKHMLATRMLPVFLQPKIVQKKHSDAPLANNLEEVQYEDRNQINTDCLVTRAEMAKLHVQACQREWYECRFSFDILKQILLKCPPEMMRAAVIAFKKVAPSKVFNSIVPTVFVESRIYLGPEEDYDLKPFFCSIH